MKGREKGYEWREREAEVQGESGERGREGGGEGRQKGKGCMGMRREGRACKVGENAQ